MRFIICSQNRHTLVCGLLTLYPESVSLVRRDTFHELEEVGGGTSLFTNGPIGLDIVVTGQFSPDEKAALDNFILFHATNDDDFVIDGKNYGKLVLREASLSEQQGDVTGKYRFRLGGYELNYLV